MKQNELNQHYNLSDKFSNTKKYAANAHLVREATLQYTEWAKK